MELSQYVTDFRFSAKERSFPWPLHFKSVEMKQVSFLHIYKWALFMYSPRTACFFERIYEDMALFSVRGTRFVPCSHLLHHIEDDMEWLGSLELDCRGM